MKQLLKEIMNKNRKVIKQTGEIIGNPSNLKYTVRTRKGVVLVDSPIKYKISDNVVIYDGVIQGYAGKKDKLKVTTV